MKALLIGGPKNGTVLYIKAGTSIITEYDGMQYEYVRKTFFIYDDGIDLAWHIWVHGPSPSTREALEMIKKENLDPVGKASDLTIDISGTN